MRIGKIVRASCSRSVLRTSSLFCNLSEICSVNPQTTESQTTNQKLLRSAYLNKIKSSAAVFITERETIRNGCVLNHLLPRSPRTMVTAPEARASRYPFPVHGNFVNRKASGNVSPTQAKGIDNATSAITKGLFCGVTTIDEALARSG